MNDMIPFWPQVGFRRKEILEKLSKVDLIDSERAEFENQKAALETEIDTLEREIRDGWKLSRSYPYDYPYSDEYRSDISKLIGWGKQFLKR